MSKKFLTVFALVALLVAAMAGTAFAAGWDVVEIVRSADQTANSLGKITVGTKTATTLPASADVYYVTGANSFKGIVAVSFDLNTGAASITDGVVSADIPGVTQFKGNYGALAEASSSKFSQISMDFTISTDFAAPIVISKIAAYQGTTIKTTAVSGELTITPKKVELKGDKTAVTIFPTAKSADVQTVSIADFGTYQFGKSLDLMLVSGDTLVAINTTINSNDQQGSIAVSFDKTAGKATFTPSATGPGAVTAAPFKYAFVMGNDVIVSADGALIAGLSTDVKANKFGEFTVEVSKPTPAYVDVDYNSAIAQSDMPAGVALINSADFAAKRDPNVTSPTSATFVGGTNFSGTQIVSVDLAGVTGNAVPLTFESGQGTLPTSADALSVSFDIRYQRVSADVTSADFEILVGDDGLFKWAEALEAGVVSFSDDMIRVNYVIVDDNKPAEKGKNFVVVYDGARDTKIVDPLWIVRKSGGGSTPYDSDSGCDMGFGAFALLGLAGAAALLRRKD